MAAQFTARKGCPARREFSWMMRATSSLPVPLSPCTSTVDSVCATVSATLRASRKLRDLPTGRAVA